MAAHIHRHAVHVGCEVRAVIKIKSTQEKLIGLAAAAVLRRDQARYGLEYFAYAEQRPKIEFLLGYLPL
jgi:hypothetical protein